MSYIRHCFIWIMAFALLAGCKHKKKPSLSGDEPVEVSDFVEFFKEVSLPFQFDDASLLKKNNDSLFISYKVLIEFVPDSVINRISGKGVKPKFYAMGKVTVPKEETYLFVKAVSNDHRIALLVCFDKKQKFIAAMPLLKPDDLASTHQFSGLDRKFSIFKTVQRKNTDGTVSEGKDVYILNKEAKNFMLIVTDQLDDKPAELINPIDTLPAKNKLSADYATGKMNLVSIRDSRRPGRFRFFIHFEKNNADCIGELKGEAMMRSPTMAEYRADMDPCILQFNFTASSVTIKEIEGCGSH
ncbi:MAG TPA: hypothetical protein VET23_04810, partial [Chitinophagaceae bacterium]|nr:hypothetical protein [Chitinophagaceae bacterium]